MVFMAQHRYHYTVNILIFLFTSWSLSSICDCRRYRLCSEGCCLHEYCAYHRICYPKTHCRFGCPDGFCAGKGKTKQGKWDTIATRSRSKFGQNPAGFSGGKAMSGPKPGSSQDKSETPSPDGVASNGFPTMGFGTAGERDYAYSQSQSEGGICMPFPPCKQGDQCGMAHSCSFNFNLGYDTCQYNLQIGTTLCFDSKGHVKLNHLS